MELLANVADSAEHVIAAMSLPIQIAHFIVVISGVRKEWDHQKKSQQPFATWFLSLVCCFGGSMLLNFFTGKAVLSAFENTEAVVLCTIVWWHIFYFPGDIVFPITSWKPISLMLCFMKEMIRTKKIRKGVSVARAVFPNSFLLCVFLGMIPACGGGFIKNSAFIFTKPWNKESIKNFHFAPLTKLCLLFSFLYNIQLDNFLPLTYNTIVLLQLITLYLFVASSSLIGSFDPFQGIETIITSMFINYSAFVSEKVENVVEKKSQDKKVNKRKAD